MEQDQQLIADFEFNGVPYQNEYYTLVKNQSYSVNISRSTNFCERSTFAWSIHSNGKYSLSSRTAQEPVMEFHEPGIYMIELSITTYGAPGWTCGTSTKSKKVMVNIPK